MRMGAYLIIVLIINCYVETERSDRMRIGLESLAVLTLLNFVKMLFYRICIVLPHSPFDVSSFVSRHMAQSSSSGLHVLAAAIFAHAYSRTCRNVCCETKYKPMCHSYGKYAEKYKRSIYLYQLRFSQLAKADRRLRYVQYMNLRQVRQLDLNCSKASLCSFFK